MSVFKEHTWWYKLQNQQPTNYIYNPLQINKSFEENWVTTSLPMKFKIAPGGFTPYFTKHSFHNKAFFKIQKSSRKIPQFWSIFNDIFIVLQGTESTRNSLNLFWEGTNEDLSSCTPDIIPPQLEWTAASLWLNDKILITVTKPRSPSEHLTKYESRLMCFFIQNYSIWILLY